MHEEAHTKLAFYVLEMFQQGGHCSTGGLYLNCRLYSFLPTQEQQAQSQGQELGKWAAQFQFPTHHEGLDDGLNCITIAGAGED